MNMMRIMQYAETWLGSAILDLSQVRVCLGRNGRIAVVRGDTAAVQRSNCTGTGNCKPESVTINGPSSFKFVARCRC